MSDNLRKPMGVIIALTVALVLTLPAFAQRPVSVATGTVIPLKMDTYLSSDSSKVGDRFTATVSRDVIIDRQLVVPANAKVEGHVTGATRAERSSKAGTIAVAFDRIVMPDGASIPVDGTLTTLNEEGRRQIDGNSIDEEDRVGGGSRTRRSVVFIGGGAGAGAVIGAVTGGAKGAAVGAGLGAVLGTIGVLVSKGEKAEVQPGTEFGMMVERSFDVNAASLGVPGDRYDNEQSSPGYYSPVREAQAALRDKGFYRGPINGEMNAETRAAIRSYQRDRNLSVTGDLDARTIRELGITADQGPSSTDYSSIDSIRSAQTTLRDRGYYNGPINGQMTASTQSAIRNFQRDRNISVTGDLDFRTARELGLAGDVRPGDVRPGDVRPGDIRPGDIRPGDVRPGPGSATSLGNARQIAFLANRLAQDYKRDLNIRDNRGVVVFDPRRNLSENEVELLFQLDALQSAAQLYGQMTVNITDQGALKGAADSLIRQMRLANRALRRNTNMRLSNVVSNDWEQLRAELRNITVTDNNLDTDVIR